MRLRGASPKPWAPEMAVQDDGRERELIRLIGLCGGPSRSGVDAFFDFSAGGVRHATPIELKSTTSRSVSTARDVGTGHIEKWRQRIWVFGFYDRSGSRLEGVLVLGPRDMEPWIGKIDRYIAPDIAIGERVAMRLSIEDLHVICGEKAVYDLDDAKSLQKGQWTKARYESEMDVDGGYSPGRMLEILKLRAKYLNARGATLNNPHIPSSYWSPFERRLTPRGNDDATLGESVRAEIRRLTLGHATLREVAKEWAARP